MTSVTSTGQESKEQLQKKIADLRKELEELNKTRVAVNTSHTTTVEDVVEGTFDGTYMVTEAGEKYEVNPNYAAKSQLLFGDKLSMTTKDGKNFFKQVNKLEKKKIEGILSKKEGKWYLLSASGSYKILDSAAEFQGAKVHDEASAFIPKGKPDVPFAALCAVKTSEMQKPKEKIESPILSEEYGRRKYDQGTASNPKKPVASTPSKSKEQINSLRVLTEEDLR